MEKMNVVVDGVPVPGYAKENDAGLDLRTTEAASIAPFETAMLGTGLRIELPEGCYGAVVPRSGIASKRGLAPINSPGTIDEGYRGEVKVPLHNFTSRMQRVEAGERIAQLIVMRYERVECVPVESLSETDRGQGGFGSTGRG